MNGPVWRVSSFCSAGGCVEVAVADRVAVRCSRPGAGPGVLRFSAAGWAVFVAAVAAAVGGHEPGRRDA